MLSSWEAAAIVRFTGMTDRKVRILDLTGAVRELPDLVVPGAPGLNHSQTDNSLIAF